MKRTRSFLKAPSRSRYLRPHMAAPLYRRQRTHHPVLASRRHSRRQRRTSDGLVNPSSRGSRVDEQSLETSKTSSMELLDRPGLSSPPASEALWSESPASSVVQKTEQALSAGLASFLELVTEAQQASTRAERQHLRHRLRVLALEVRLCLEEADLRLFWDEKVRG